MRLKPIKACPSAKQTTPAKAGQRMDQTEVGNKWVNRRVALATWQQLVSCLLPSRKVCGMRQTSAAPAPALLEPAGARRLGGDAVSCWDEAGALSRLNPLSLTVQSEWPRQPQGNYTDPCHSCGRVRLLGSSEGGEEVAAGLLSAGRIRSATPSPPKGRVSHGASTLLAALLHREAQNPNPADQCIP